MWEGKLDFNNIHWDFAFDKECRGCRMKNERVRFMKLQVSFYSCCQQWLIDCLIKIYLNNLNNWI